MNSEDMEIFNKQIRSAFAVYDQGQKGYQEFSELRTFIDAIRSNLSQHKADDAIFNRIFNILDEDGNGEIELNELFSKMEDVMPILTECGKEMEDLIRKAFYDFDIDCSGYLERGEQKLLCNLACDRMGVERCEKWQIDYIISLIDDDGNCQIDVDEFVANYRLINEELLKNKKTKSREKSKDKIVDFQRVGFKSKRMNSDDAFITSIGAVAKMYQKQKKKKEVQIGNFKKGVEENQLNVLTQGIKEKACNFLPINIQVNNKTIKDNKDVDHQPSVESNNMKKGKDDETENSECSSNKVKIESPNVNQAKKGLKKLDTVESINYSPKTNLRVLTKCGDNDGVSVWTSLESTKRKLENYNTSNPLERTEKLLNNKGFDSDRVLQTEALVPGKMTDACIAKQKIFKGYAGDFKTDPSPIQNVDKQNIINKQKEKSGFLESFSKDKDSSLHQIPSTKKKEFDEHKSNTFELINQPSPEKIRYARFNTFEKSDIQGNLTQGNLSLLKLPSEVTRPLTPRSPCLKKLQNISINGNFFPK